MFASRESRSLHHEQKFDDFIDMSISFYQISKEFSVGHHRFYRQAWRTDEAIYEQLSEESIK